MTDARPEHSGKSAFSDPILAARVDALMQLAGGMKDQVAVMDREFNVIYANEAAWGRTNPGESGERPAKCYEAFVQLQDHCSACPATSVFDSQEAAKSVAAAATPCGMYQALPLTSSNGEVGMVLVLFRQPPSGTVTSLPIPEPMEGTRRPERRSEGLGELIGSSPGMRQLFDMITLVSDSSATVLIQGESGTGKELVARTIHKTSYRRDKPFVVVDCGSLPETLLESELFGHVKGAFTGASSAKRGLFEEADGGTVFLDEIADTTPTFQAKLLRVLQEGEIKRVGGTQSIKIDVRVISASNKDLAELVKMKAFRQDLYYRLAVLPLHLPPLRDRREDIPLLANHFLRIHSTRYRKLVTSFDNAALKALESHPWQGNVRELDHAIERAVLMAQGTLVKAGDLGLYSAGQEGGARLEEMSLDEVERFLIKKTLERFDGNVSKAAEALGLSRSALYRRLEKYGL